MIIFIALGAFLILGLTAVLGGYLVKGLSALISQPLASLLGKDESDIRSFVQTGILLVLTLLITFFSQRSCSRGWLMDEAFGDSTSFEGVSFVVLGWFLLATALICFGITIWRFKLALDGDKPKVKTRKVF